jgi:thiosulfate/3-mercaptopyruvate sulfurtransferase
MRDVVMPDFSVRLLVVRPNQLARSWMCFATAFLFLFSWQIQSAAEPSPVDQKAERMLIEPVELEQLLGQRRLSILDTRSKEEYGQGHIPGAVWVDVTSWQQLGRAPRGFHNAEAWAEMVSAIGISDDSRVVVYGSSLPSTGRIWWTLKYLGHGDVGILNGGWDAWVKEKRAIEIAPSIVSAGSFTPRFQSDRLEELDSLKQTFQSGEVRILDTRSAAEFRGEDVRGPRGGHIPGATHLEWKELLAADGRFKTPEELRELFREKGLLPNQTAVCY